MAEKWISLNPSNFSDNAEKGVVVGI